LSDVPALVTPKTHGDGAAAAGATGGALVVITNANPQELWFWLVYW
jgi:hypothetical protein